MHAVSPTDEIFLITALWHLRESNFFFIRVLFCHRFETGYLLQKSEKEHKNIKMGCEMQQIQTIEQENHLQKKKKVKSHAEEQNYNIHQPTSMTEPLTCTIHIGNRWPTIFARWNWFLICIKRTLDKLKNWVSTHTNSSKPWVENLNSQCYQTCLRLAVVITSKSLGILFRIKSLTHPPTK